MSDSDHQDPRLQPVDEDSAMPGEFVDVPPNEPGEHDGAELPDAPITAARTGADDPDS